MGFLDGDIANLVADNLIAAGISKPIVLTRVTPGIRQPGAVTAGTNPTRLDYSCQGVDVATVALQMAGTLIAGVTRVIKIYGATLPAGVSPQPGDRLVMGGVTATIASESGAVSVDAARACFTCQCKV